jgi:hypothetical protein
MGAHGPQVHRAAPEKAQFTRTVGNGRSPVVILPVWGVPFDPDDYAVYRL